MGIAGAGRGGPRPIVICRKAALMSLPKPRFFAMLATFVALAAAAGISPYTTEFVAEKPNTSLHDPMLTDDGSLWYGGRSTNRPPSDGMEAFGAATEMPPGAFLPRVFLPVQFKNAKGLGLGKLLVASRGLADPLFARTVILLVRYDEKGVLGLMLNQRTHVPLSRVLDLKAAKDRSDPAYAGGPVGPSAVFALVQSPTKVEGAENIFGGVYLISDKTLFERTLSARPDSGVFHVYLGYAGWTKDQLRNEVELGAWFVFPGDAGTVFNSDPDSLWPQMIRETEMEMAKNEAFSAHPSLRQEAKGSVPTR
jgi:putative AlgH/UPF0301 family transcriptional regulator